MVEVWRPRFESGWLSKVGGGLEASPFVCLGWWVPNLHQLYRASRVLNGGHRTSTTLLAKFHTGGYKHLQGLLSFLEVPALTYILLPALTNLPESQTIASKLPPGLTTVPESQTIGSLTMLWSFLELQRFSYIKKPFQAFPSLTGFQTSTGNSISFTEPFGFSNKGFRPSASLAPAYKAIQPSWAFPRFQSLHTKTTSLKNPSQMKQKLQKPPPALLSCSES